MKVLSARVFAGVLLFLAVFLGVKASLFFMAWIVSTGG